MDILLLLALVLGACHVAERVTGRLGLPAVTGYVIGGVGIGALLFRVLGPDLPNRLGFASDVALGLIAFTVGSELYGAEIKRLARSVFAIAVAESLAAFLLVGLGVWAVTGDAVLALLLGAVACATAPAATVMVVEQYRARGPLTSTVLAVVGIDDAVALIIYGFASAAAEATLEHSRHLNLARAIGLPLIEILASLVVGVALGYLGSVLLRRARGPRETATGAGALILLGTALAREWDLSALLTAMAMGCAIVNLDVRIKRRIASALADVCAVLYGIFFVVAGSRLDVSLLPAVGLTGLVYVLARAAGKIGGGTLGAALGGAGPTVRKYVGLSLIPQIGVAVALAILVSREFGHDQYGTRGNQLAATVLNILLVTTIATEIIGPLLTRMTLRRAGEIGAGSGAEESP